MSTFKQWLQKIYVTYISKDQKAISYWRYIECGGENLRLDYPLKENSLVIDIGGVCWRLCCRHNREI